MTILLIEDDQKNIQAVSRDFGTASIAQTADKAIELLESEPPIWFNSIFVGCRLEGQWLVKGGELQGPLAWLAERGPAEGREYVRVTCPYMIIARRITTLLWQAGFKQTVALPYGGEWILPSEPDDLDEGVLA
jgi:hypothetical protein